MLTMRNRKKTRDPNVLTRREKNEMNARLRQFRAMEERKRLDEDETAQHNPPDTSEPNLPKRLDVERLTAAAQQYRSNVKFGIQPLIEAFGTDDRDFIWCFINSLSAASAGTSLGNDALAFMISVVKNEKPKSQLEAMHISQMAATHLLAMKLANQLNHVENLPHQDSAERAYNKLTRTFTNQLDALKRYRTGGEQKVTVQHVSVGEGGRAIVAHVTHGIRGSKVAAPVDTTAILTDARQATMPMIDTPECSPVPVQRRGTNDDEQSST
jgi:hypothetical protein